LGTDLSTTADSTTRQNPMFTVSDNATSAIREIVTRPGLPEGAGLRIAANADRNLLSIAVTAQPQPGDTVFQAASDAPLFIANEAADLLEDKMIDAVTDNDGQVQFVLDSSAR
jgi:iron-sulfur cluster assembly protein